MDVPARMGMITHFFALSADVLAVFHNFSG
jgi:hypothetical protein